MKLSAIRRERPTRADRILVYGQDKAGKTTFAAGAPAPVFICGEDGLPPHVDVPSFPPPDDVNDLLETIGELGKATEYQTLVVDTLDWIDHKIRDEIMRAKNWDAEAYGRYGRGHGVALEHHRRIIQSLDELRAAGCLQQIILICHAETKNVSNPSGDDYARISPKVSGQLAPALYKEWSDSILLVEIESVVSGDGFRKKHRLTGQRVLRCAPGNGYDAGSRWDLPMTLPLAWDAYAGARAASSPGAAGDMLVQARELLATIEGHPAHKTAAAFVDDNETDAKALYSAINRIRTIAQSISATQKEND